MARLTKPLTPTKIRTAKSKDKVYRLHDGFGLAVAIYPSGRKVYQFRYKDRNGKEKTLTLPEHSKEYGLDEARLDRDRMRYLLQNGKDPCEEKRQSEHTEDSSQDNTFEKVAVRCINSKHVTSEHSQRMLQSLKRHIFPRFGAMNIADIKPKELFETFKAIAEQINTTNKAGKKKTYMAKRVCSWCAEVYDFYSAEQGYQVNNPCRLMVRQLPAHRQENAKQIPLSELNDFFAGLDEYQGGIRYAIYMMLYTTTDDYQAVSGRLFS